MCIRDRLLTNNTSSLRHHFQPRCGDTDQNLGYCFNDHTYEKVHTFSFFWFVPSPWRKSLSYIYAQIRVFRAKGDHLLHFCRYSVSEEMLQFCCKALSLFLISYSDRQSCQWSSCIFHMVPIFLELCHWLGHGDLVKKWTQLARPQNLHFCPE